RTEAHARPRKRPHQCLRRQRGRKVNCAWPRRTDEGQSCGHGERTIPPVARKGDRQWSARRVEQERTFARRKRLLRIRPSPALKHVLARKPLCRVIELEEYCAARRLLDQLAHRVV